jgi:HD superfamily phosphohydrolase
VEHLLLQRLFAYQQIAYHKVVAAFEKVLEDVFSALLDRDLLDCSRSSMLRMVENGSWSTFDDSSVLAAMRELRKDNPEEPLKRKLDSILDRLPPRLVFESQKFEPRANLGDKLKVRKKELRQCAKDLAEEYSEDQEAFLLWDPTISLTKVGASSPTWEAPSDEDVEQLPVVIRDGSDPRPITRFKSSLMSVLADYVLSNMRLYYVPPSEMPGDKVDERTEKMRKSMKLKHPMLFEDED